MQVLTRFITLAALLLSAMNGAQAQSSQAQSPQAQSSSAESKAAAGSISGRVLIAGQGAKGVPVLLQSTDLPRPLLVTVKTDEDGRFHLPAVPAGSYRLSSFAPAFVLIADLARSSESSKLLTLSAGEVVEGIDLILTRGSVITGCITDADGQPVIEQRVRLDRLTERGQQDTFSTDDGQMLETDDRGIYRVYGLRAGRYLVSVGMVRGEMMVMGQGGPGPYPRTFHPHVTDESKAIIVEVTEGAETANIDIQVGRPMHLNKVTGRMVDAESGQPVPNAAYAVALIRQNSNIKSGSWSPAWRTNAQGEFRLEGFAPGRYAISAKPDEQSDFYSDPINFEVHEADVGGLEIAAHRATSISGVVAVEGITDPAVLAKVPQLALVASSTTPEPNPALSDIQARINPNGRFQITGLRAGTIHLSLVNQTTATTSTPKGFAILRTERDGIAQPNGLAVAPGEQITGVHVVIAYHSGVVRGQIRIEGGALPEGIAWSISIGRSGDSLQSPLKWVQPDARGHFVFEELPPGNYFVLLSPISIPLAAQPLARLLRLTQRVTVTPDAESQVTFVVNLSGK